VSPRVRECERVVDVAPDVGVEDETVTVQSPTPAAAASFTASMMPW
jgi:hypothetical protein